MAGDFFISIMKFINSLMLNKEGEQLIIDADLLKILFSKVFKNELAENYSSTFVRADKSRDYNKVIWDVLLKDRKYSD